MSYHELNLEERMNAAGVCNTTSWAAEGVKKTRSTKVVERY